MDSAITLKHAPLFAGLAAQDMQALLAVGRTRLCARGQALFAHGALVTHFYIIVSGTFQLFRTTPEGGEKTIELLTPGRTMGENEIMDTCRHYRTNAVAVDDAVVLEFPASWLKDAAKKYHGFALNLLSVIAGQAHLAQVEAEQQATMSAAQLVACFLQRLCVLYDFDPAGFELPYSKTLIASRLGMEVETFSRTLAKLKAHGISVQGTQVAIHDLQRIGQYVCSACSIAGDCATHQAMEEKTGQAKKPC